MCIVAFTVESVAELSVKYPVPWVSSINMEAGTIRSVAGRRVCSLVGSYWLRWRCTLLPARSLLEAATGEAEVVNVRAASYVGVLE